MKAVPQSRRAAYPLPPALPREMTRCECLGVSFETLARRMAAEKRSLESLMAETGVGQLCTACVPDLRTAVARAKRHHA